MGLPRKGPRLYLRKGTGRRPMWIIRHDGRMFGTGFSEDERDLAEKAFEAYCDAGRFSPARLRQTGNLPCPDKLYFVTCAVPDFPVKIGLTAYLDDRIKTLQVALPYRVVVLATLPGDYERERLFHLRFARIRLQGEWFERTPDLMDMIRSLAVEAHQANKFSKELEELFIVARSNPVGAMP